MQSTSTTPAKSFFTVTRECISFAADIFSLVGIPIAIYLFSKQSLATSAGRDQLFSLWIYGPAIFGLAYSLFAIAYYAHCKRTNSAYPAGTNIILGIPVLLFAIAVIALYVYDWPGH